jgi:hypothetical protein
MSGYEKVSLLKFEAAGQSWYVTDYGRGTTAFGENPELAYVEIEEVRKDSQEDSHKEGCVCPSTGEWSWDNEIGPEEKAAIVEYLRANPLPGETE